MTQCVLQDPQIEGLSLNKEAETFAMTGFHVNQPRST